LKRERKKRERKKKKKKRKKKAESFMEIDLTLVFLVIIFGGALMGFTLAKLQLLDINGTFCGQKSRAAPGECFYFSRGRWKVGLLLHLACIFRKFRLVFPLILD
jgi:hypothetical protein